MKFASIFTRKTITSLALVLILVGGLLATLYVAKRNQDIRQRASTASGTATIELSPGSSTIATGSATTISLIGNMQNAAVDGIQFVATITPAQGATIPSDLSFQTATISGMQVASSILEATGSAMLLHVAYVIQDPTIPLITAAPTLLGTLTFTAPSTGTMMIDFDQTLSKIVQNQTTTDIAALIGSATYTFSDIQPPTANAVNWTTPTVALSAHNFYIIANGQLFTAQNASNFTLTSDPGSATYTTLEATWMENGTEMRLFIYFGADSTNWWIKEMRTYNGNQPGDWFYYGTFSDVDNRYHFPNDTNTLGSALPNGQSVTYTPASPLNNAQVHFDNVTLRAFINLGSNTPTPIPESERIAACTTTGGAWQQFSDGCGDSCQLISDPNGTVCTLAITNACQCGASQCWNGTTCVVNPISPAAILNSFIFTTKFIGVDRDRGAIPIHLQLGAMGSATILYEADITMTHSGNGVYQTTVTPNITPPAGALWITLKGKKHLQRAFTNLTITNGSALDLTTKVQEPGDLPNQDMQVNTDDLNKLLEVIAAPTQTQADWDIADVNYDGVVNAVDLGLILNTLSVKPDETIQ